MRRTWILVGAGFTGGRLAARLAAAPDEVDELVLVRRDVAPLAGLAGQLAAHLPVRTVAVDLADPTALAAALAIPDGAVVVHLAPPALPDGAAERALAAAARAAHRLVYVSSTGVYAPAAGAWVDEAWSLAPATAAGAARIAAERALTDACAPTPRLVILRAAGIYGPGRGVASRLREGTYRVIGDGSAHTSRVHVDDLAAAIHLAATAADPAAIYNVADDDPCPTAEYADAAAALLGLPPPPRVPVETVPAEVAGMLLANRRIDAGRLKRELGWAPAYPSWRDALE